MKPEQSLIFELSRPGRSAYSLPQCDVPQDENLDALIPAGLLRSSKPCCRKYPKWMSSATTPRCPAATSALTTDSIRSAPAR